MQSNNPQQLTKLRRRIHQLQWNGTNNTSSIHNHSNFSTSGNKIIERRSKPKIRFRGQAASNERATKRQTRDGDSPKFGNKPNSDGRNPPTDMSNMRLSSKFDIVPISVGIVPLILGPESANNSAMPKRSDALAPNSNQSLRYCLSTYSCLSLTQFRKEWCPSNHCRTYRGQLLEAHD